jgi:hypothetical protein
MNLRKSSLNNFGMRTTLIQTVSKTMLFGTLCTLVVSTLVVSGGNVCKAQPQTSKPLASSTTTEAASQEVIAVIKTLFEGMSNSDSAKVRSTFDESAHLQTVALRQGKPVLRSTSIEEFIKAVGAPKKERWEERVLTYEVRVDDRLATAWTPYQFYVGTTFSHCGVNAFQLWKSEQGWKILNITDTRRKEGCGQ